ncbi:MAG: AAA family ATPase [Nannocystaceae bacterium]|nr:AAA family ATPase [bacterium]
MIICLCGQKGGSGKSTLSQSIASEYMRRGRHVFLGDADPQGTSLSWAAAAEGAATERPTVLGLPEGFHAPGQVPTVAKQFDRTVIDTAPRLDSIQRSALAIATLALFPVSAGPAETWAFAEPLRLIREAQAFRPELKVGVILNRHQRTSMTRETVATMEATGVRVLKTRIGLRTAFQQAMAAGEGVTTYEPQSAAAKEIMSLVDEIEEICNAKEDDAAA